MRITEIVIDPKQSTYERLIAPTLVDQIENLYQKLKFGSNNFQLQANSFLPIDSIHELLTGLSQDSDIVKDQINLGTQSQTYQLLQALIQYLDPY